MSQTPITKKHKKNSDGNRLIDGAVLGTFGAFWGSFLFMCLYQVAQIVPGIFLGEFASKDLADYAITVTFLGMGLGIGFLIAFFVSVIPATLAGMFNTWILNSIANKGSFFKKQAVAIGMIVGCIFCLIPVGVSIQFFNFLYINFPIDGELMDVTVRITVIGMLTSSVVGIWHSIQLVRHLTFPT